MIPIAEFQRRALSGPVMKEQEFDKAFSRKVREVVSRYDIEYDPECIIAGNKLADAVFQGGVDLLAEVGIYHRDTQRVIQLTKGEIQQIAKDAWDGPRKETFGKGKDQVTVHYRTARDPRPPVMWFGTTCASTEELFIPYIQSFAQEDLAQGIHGNGLISAGGLGNRAGTPAEVAVALAEIKYKQEVARRVGKPDMYMGGIGAISPGAIMAICFPGGVERHNAMVSIHLMPELKLDWNRLVLALCLEERGLVPGTSCNSVMGAHCRGPADAAVAQIANLLGQLGYGHGTIAKTLAVGMDGARSTREVLWAYSAAARASERHVGVPMGASTMSAAGAGTETAFYEKATEMTAFVASGNAWIYGMGCRKGTGLNTTTGLEGRLVAETAHAVPGMSRDKTNQLLKNLLALYEDQLSAAPEGKTFPELYDVKTVQPKAEYLAVYQRAKDRLARVGIPYR